MAGISCFITWLRHEVCIPVCGRPTLCQNSVHVLIHHDDPIILNIDACAVFRFQGATDIQVSRAPSASSSSQSPPLGSRVPRRRAPSKCPPITSKTSRVPYGPAPRSTGGLRSAWTVVSGSSFVGISFCRLLYPQPNLHVHRARQTTLISPAARPAAPVQWIVIASCRPYRAANQATNEDSPFRSFVRYR